MGIEPQNAQLIIRLKKKVKTIRVDVIIRTKRKIKRFRVKDWVIHKGYKYGTILVNDIAVLTLKKPVQYNACVKPIRLPRKDDHITRVCTISGWGFTKANDTRLSDSLRYSNMVIRSPETCEMLGPMDRRYHLCTGDFHEGGPNICKGDSGGPLVCYLPNKKEVLLGISSFIYDCNGNFAVFTNVITYVKWIEKQMMES
ncbi:plasma kallikrein-like [Octopus vulgaris]|uniref:Plasma kallikrein-like n=1 Tax=Octopus vulgaris TaxID=6645 RepID=A0AA36BXB5_OCTVU|nr:plasma kallikrein-like [Octopus vulgaris]